MSLYIVVGPPAAGKSTWVARQAQPGDITIDFDKLANTLSSANTSTHDHPPHIQFVTQSARRAAIDAAVRFRNLIDVYVIHSRPTDAMMRRYKSLGAEIVTIDPGQEVVMERIKRERPAITEQEVTERWYNKQGKQL